MPTLANLPKPAQLGLKILGIVLCLYLFIVAVSGMGEAFEMFGEGFAERVLSATQNPFAAFLMGLLATSIVQSSSTTTSIMVGMVAGGALTIEAAIPMVMGANIGTTITAMLVSFGSINNRTEFERAFAASLLHLFFNLIAVAIILPLEMAFGLLSTIAVAGQNLFTGVGGMSLANPIKAATGPVINVLKFLTFGNAILMLIATIAMTYGTLVGLVKFLRSLVLAKAEAFFDRVLFKDWRVAMLFGLILTVAVQTSSVPTSLSVPLAGAGILKLIQIYPFTLGCNVGTTVSAFLAALATGQELPVVVAFSHTAFNLLGILFIWFIPPMRKLPLLAAQKIGAMGAQNRYIPILLLAGVYFIVPIILVLIIS